MPEAEADHRPRVVGYYAKPESRLSYRLLLGGTNWVVEASAMRSLPWFVRGGFPAMLEQAGFEVVLEEDISERMWPMLRRLARICWLPARAGRLLGARRALLNCAAAVEAYRHRQGWRYNVVVARRP